MENSRRSLMESTRSTLSAPLLGVKPDELDQEFHTRSIVPLDNAILVPSHEDEEHEEQESFCYDVFIVWVALPFLLFVQFGVAFLAQEDTTTNNLSWTIVNVSIVLFALTVWLYREACADSKIETCLLVLLPEIILNTVLILVLVKKTPVAFYALLLGMELLSILAIIASVQYLYCSHRRRAQEEKMESNKLKEAETPSIKAADYAILVV